MSNNNLKSKKNQTALFNNLMLCVLLEQFPGLEQINGVRTGFDQFPLEIRQHLNCIICLFAKALRFVSLNFKLGKKNL